MSVSEVCEGEAAVRLEKQGKMKSQLEAARANLEEESTRIATYLI